MDAPQFNRLVAGLEIDSQYAPVRFRRRTALWGLLGYAAVWAVLAASIVGLVAMAFHFARGERAAGWQLALAAASLLMLYSALRALWAPVAAPAGRVLTRADAPRLFALIDKLRRRTGGPRIDRVLLDAQLNAGVIQQPRLGVLGWHRNHLVIGLPLLMSLDLRQFVAVLAHEYGHLAGAHGRFSGWVYRTRRSWMRLAQTRRDARTAGSIADGVQTVFLDHYFPHFNARALVLARRQEFEADAAAHRLAGRAASAQSLVQIGLATRYLEEVFWPQIWRGAIGGSLRPTASPYAAMADTLGRVSRLPQAPRWLQQAWKATPHGDDTHPSLRQRLEFAGEKPTLPPTVRRSAASALLGSGLDRWCRAFDETWRRDALGEWLLEAQRFSDERGLRASLRSHATKHALSPDEALRLARCTVTLEGDAAGRLALKQALATYPRHAPTRHALALVKLASVSRASQAQGFALLQEVAEGEGPLAIDALERSIAWLESQHHLEDVEPLRTSLEEKRARQRAADADHHNFHRPQGFDTPQISPRLQRAALSVLKRESAIGGAWLVRKRCESGPLQPFHVLLIERSRQRPPMDADAWRSGLRARLDLPGDWMLIDATHRHWRTPARKAVLAQLRKTPGARLAIDR